MTEDKFKGVVLHGTQLSDNTDLLTVLTDRRGKKLITCHGAKKLTGRNMPAIQLFCYSEFTVRESNNRLTLKEASLIESFFDLRCDLIRSALGQYMLEAACECAREEEDEKELLQLLLNSLFALCKGICSHKQIKAAFELRLLRILGTEPSDCYCARCGDPLQPGGAAYSPAEGGLLCDRCADVVTTVDGFLDSSAREALGYILRCPAKRLFSFSLSPNSLRALGKLSEASMLYFYEHHFETLKFYHRIVDETTEDIE